MAYCEIWRCIHTTAMDNYPTNIYKPCIIYTEYAVTAEDGVYVYIKRCESKITL